MDKNSDNKTASVEAVEEVKPYSTDVEEIQPTTPARNGVFTNIVNRLRSLSTASPPAEDQSESPEAKTKRLADLERTDRTMRGVALSIGIDGGMIHESGRSSPKKRNSQSSERDTAGSSPEQPAAPPTTPRKMMGRLVDTVGWIKDNAAEKVNEALRDTDKESNRRLGPYENQGLAGVSDFDPISSGLASALDKDDKADSFKKAHDDNLDGKGGDSDDSDVKSDVDSPF
ncbi:hypothetical protein BT63DRAFT_418126 [Microthyrium microscopicum]|uniref:Uncharacterized protein n=1 Tax=Microthyrium microscopicum TaxID=703497 RepID=A0A6A6U0Y9_9PEZI|nr:hypothetical protein BT63DRAFT_418126 [Microthyrium microscopicum]